MKPLETGDPRSVGRYRVLARLGSGGMARVLLGASPDGRLVAIKQVHEWLATDDDFRARFRREVSTSRSVSGAYTAAVMDADTEAQRPWLASAYVPGPPLDAAVARCGGLPVRSTRVLAAGLSAALAEIHRCGLVHRDLKPSNVLLADDGPRLIDFGIARATRNPTQVTRSGIVVGSPGYLSPEQAEGRALTAASDVFSLGAVLTYAATGAQPFGTGSVPQQLYRVVHTEPDLAGLPAELRDLVVACLAKDAAGRPGPDEVLGMVGGVGVEAWLPAAADELIAEQRAELRAVLAGSRATAAMGSGWSAPAATLPAPTLRAPTPMPPPHPIGPRSPVPRPPPPPAPPRSRAPWWVLGAVLGVVALIGSAVAVLVYLDSRPEPLAAVRYDGLPEACRGVGAGPLGQLRVGTPDTGPARRDLEESYTLLRCSWNDGNYYLTAELTTLLATELLDDPDERARSTYDRDVRAYQGRFAPEPIGDEATFVEQDVNTFDADLVARDGTKVVRVDYAYAGVDQPPLSIDQARAQLRTIAVDMLRIENTPP